MQHHQMCIVDGFGDTGSVKGQSGQKPSVRTPDKIEALREALQSSPKKATHRLAQLVGTSPTTVGRIVHGRSETVFVQGTVTGAPY